MNKTDLILKLATEGNISQRQASKLLNIVLDSISDTLAEGDKVTIPNFGTFKVSDLAARNGRDPRTGRSIRIAARKKASFSAGSGLKTAVRGGNTGNGGPGGRA